MFLFICSHYSRSFEKFKVQLRKLVYIKSRIKSTIHFKFGMGGICLLWAILQLSCKEQDLSDEAFSIGNELMDSHTQLGYIDTLSVKLSTVIMDSVRTSNTGRMLVGQYTDGDFGTINSSSYFQVTVPFATVGTNATFDSLTLVLTYDGYYYGDTLKEQTMYVYPVADWPEENDDVYYYNTSKVKVETNLLGQKTFQPRISKETLEIRLSDSLGVDLFQKMVDKELSSQASFLEDFPGIALISKCEGGAIMGYSIEDSSSYMKMYFHQTLAEKEERTAIFEPVNTNIQFNHIETDRTGTALESWNRQRVPIPSSQTNNRVFVQGATGVLTRIEFPTLQYFIELGVQGSLLKAELIFIPIKGTYDNLKIPENTVLYQTDKYSALGTEVYDTDNEVVQLGETHVDNQYHESTFISFDISKYFRYDFLDQYYDQDNGFLLGILAPDYYSNLDRLVLATQDVANYKPLLRVYYILYDLE